MTRQEMEEFAEQAIDSHGVEGLLTAIVDVCHAKADHVETAWQEKGLARRWRLGAKRVEKAAANFGWPL